MSQFTVLGATGVIGQALVSHLRRAGHKVWAPTRHDPDIWNRPLGHVIYAIGVTADFRSRPLDTVEAHVCQLRKCLQSARFESLLYLSSTRVYAGCPDGSRAIESAPLMVSPHQPSDLYNLSKLMGESLCLQAGIPGVRIARLSNVVGGQDEETENFIPSILREARSGRVLLRSHPDSAKDYIHINDVVHLLSAISMQGTHTSYNVASGRQLTHEQWLSALSELTRCRVEIQPQAPLLSFPAIDISRIQSEFEFSPQNPLEALPDYLTR